MTIQQRYFHNLVDGERFYFHFHTRYPYMDYIHEESLYRHIMSICWDNIIIVIICVRYWNTYFCRNIRMFFKVCNIIDIWSRLQWDCFLDLIVYDCHVLGLVQCLLIQYKMWTIQNTFHLESMHLLSWDKDKLSGTLRIFLDQPIECSVQFPKFRKNFHIYPFQLS